MSVFGNKKTLRAMGLPDGDLYTQREAMLSHFNFDAFRWNQDILEATRNSPPEDVVAFIQAVLKNFEGTHYHFVAGKLQLNDSKSSLEPVQSESVQEALTQARIQQLKERQAEAVRQIVVYVASREDVQQCLLQPCRVYQTAGYKNINVTRAQDMLLQAMRLPNNEALLETLVKIQGPESVVLAMRRADTLSLENIKTLAQCDHGITEALLRWDEITGRPGITSEADTKNTLAWHFLSTRDNPEEFRGLLTLLPGLPVPSDETCMNLLLQKASPHLFLQALVDTRTWTPEQACNVAAQMDNVLERRQNTLAQERRGLGFFIKSPGTGVVTAHRDTLLPGHTREAALT